MNLYINNLSFQENFVPGDKTQLLKNFLDVSEGTLIYDIEKIIVPENYSKNYFAKELSFESCFYEISNDPDDEKKLHTRIKSILANQFKVIEKIQVDRIPFWLEWLDSESEFLKKGFVNRHPVISFKTHGDFESDLFSVVKVELDENGESVKNNEKILNLSDVGHFHIHQGILSELQEFISQLNAKWDPLKEPLRFIDRIKTYLKENNYLYNLSNYKGIERISLAITVGKEIAAMNGWEYHNDYSRKNNRPVFKSRNKTVYLAIDTETVSFELHNRSGKHEGEYNFVGEKIEDAKGHTLEF